MLQNIEHVMEENQITGRVFCDLFAGSGAVGDFFKNRFSILSNDYLYALCLINRAKLLHAQRPTFQTFVRAYGTDPFDYFNGQTYTYNQQYFIANTYSPLGGRSYFTVENAVRIDGIRLEIETLYRDRVLSDGEREFLIASLLESVMSFSNTTGTYEAFLKAWDKRALKPFVLSPIEFREVPSLFPNTVFHADSNALLREIHGDILYIDPPYTITNYNSAYHLLESIAKYDYPQVNGITGRRADDNANSRYTQREHALRNFEDLFRQADFEHILISYSTQGLVSVEELTALAERFAVHGSLRLYYFPYREYKNIRSSKKGDDLNEVILYFKKDRSVIRSPLNYTGSKYSIFREIQKVMPKHISTFVDIMGGAFNVGVNVVAEEVVYNEFLPHTYDLISLCLKEDKEKIIAHVEKIVHEYALKKGDKPTYAALRAHYNASKDVYELFVLQMYCFQNQMRFNSGMQFNTPIGNCSYNESIAERLRAFVPKTASIKLVHGSYADLDLSGLDRDSVVYFDPPYFITSATYNDGKRGFVGWNADEEGKLLDFIAALDARGRKFILSNVLYHNGETNYLLKGWVEAHGYRVTAIGDVGSKNSRSEVLITNFDWREER